jgi:hypothetical protein
MIPVEKTASAVLVIRGTFGGNFKKVFFHDISCITIYFFLIMGIFMKSASRHVAFAIATVSAESGVQKSPESCFFAQQELPVSFPFVGRVPERCLQK